MNDLPEILRLVADDPEAAWGSQEELKQAADALESALTEGANLKKDLRGLIEVLAQEDTNGGLKGFPAILVRARRLTAKYEFFDYWSDRVSGRQSDG